MAVVLSWCLLLLVLSWTEGMLSWCVLARGRAGGRPVVSRETKETVL